MPFSQSNKFLNELLAAMESSGGEPSIEEVQNGPLGSEAMGRDPSGNPDGPGDPESTPDPDGSVVPQPNPEDPMANANCPSGNPDGPGDPQADPATEGLISAFKGWREDKRTVAAMYEKSIEELLPTWLAAIRISNNYLYGTEGKKLLQDAINKRQLFDPREFTADPKVVMDKAKVGNADFYYVRIYEGEKVVQLGVPLAPKTKIEASGYTNNAGVVGSDVAVVNGTQYSKTKEPSVETIDEIDMVQEIYAAIRNNRRLGQPGVVPGQAAEADVTVPEPIDFNSIPSGSAIPASAVGKFDEFLKNVSTEKSTHLIEIEGQKDGYDASGNSGSPGEQGDPVNTDGEPKKAPAEPQTTKANDPSGNPGSPGVNGDPVSKSGAPVPQSKTEAERTADDPSGNPDSPGVDGDPDPGFESFIAVCEQAMVTRKPGTVFIPKGMSLESYAMQIGLGEITARALEADLSEAERNKLPNSAFGLPKERKWPLNDESHVRQAIRYFARCPAEQQRELAKNILKAMRKFGMNDVKVGKNNPFRKYCPDVAVG